ncbi:MAG: hypothetical protein HYR91_10720 [Flavobacteriia bacterium]|nr:hypothetical protein [Flavobacteriia bacterium]
MKVKKGLFKKKSITCFLLFIISSFQGYATNITTTRTDVTGYSSWTDVNVNGTTYLQLYQATSNTITPAMDFTAYTSQTLDFKARTFGGVNAANNCITVSISTNNGTSWTVLGTRTPSSSTLTSQTQFDLSAYTSTQVKIKFETLGANSSIGAGIDDITIAGTIISCTPPTTQSSSMSFSSITSNSTNVNWIRGDGNGGVIVVVKSGSSVNTDPTSGTNYTANSTMGTGTQIGTGNYVVYQGTGTSVNVTGLSSGTTYYYAVYEYNSSGTCYNLTELSGNQATIGSLPTDYFRSLTTGNWNTTNSWQSSSDNSSWINSSLVPSNSASSILIQAGHTITINEDATASTVLINGTLSFDSFDGRLFDVTGDITISSTGTFNAPNATGYAYMSTTGNLINNNILDFYTIGACDVTFNKNGNQTISGTGGTTKFNVMTVDMGTSNSNILEIMPSNFFTNTEFLHYAANTANELLNGTVKFSGTYTYANEIFYTGKSHDILANCGIWLNNPNVTITASADSWDLTGLLRITQGTMNIGTSSGNSLRTKGSNAQIIIEGGALNIAGRLTPTTANSNPFSYTQSGGTVTLNTVGSASGTLAAFDMSSTSSSFTMSNGTIIIRRKTSNSKDYNNSSNTYNVTGGTIQFGDASTPTAQTFNIYSTADMPNLIVSNATSQATKPTVQLTSNINVKGSITIMSGTTLDVSYNGGTSNYDIALTDTWNNSGTFTARNKTVTFAGNSNQSITGSATTSFYNLTNSNTSTGLTLNHGVLVSNTLNMNGATANILLNSYNIDLSSTGIIIGETNSDRIYGTSGLITTTRIVNMPSALNLAGMGISFTSSANFGSTTLSRGHSQQDVNGYPSILRYYIISPSTNSGLDATITFDYFDNELNGLGAIESNFKLFRSTDAGISWIDRAGNENTASNNITLSNIDAFSWWTVAADISVPLPVELLNFSAKSKQNVIEIIWSTAVEINSNYFTIERSLDGKDFKSINQIHGAGNSTSIINYTYNDYEYSNCMNYYRLKQVDLNGVEKYTSTIAVDMTQTEAFKIKTINSLGQEVNEYYNGVVFDLYTDGKSIKRIQ